MEVGEANTKAYTLDGTMDLRGRPVLASKTGKWKACAFLLAYEAFERMAFYGIASNLVVYLTTQLHEDTVSSVRNVNDWNGIVWMTPVLGAYLADAYLGRYWTFTISSLVYVLCMVLLTMVVSLKSFKPRTCTNNTCNNNDSSSASKIAMFYISLYVIALGAGGTKPNISTFGADQFDDINPQEKQLKVSFFNWWMFCAFLGGLFATVALVYIQENLGWGLGYGIPTVGLVLSLIVFYIGTPIYRHKARNLKSPATDVFRVFIAAMANRKLKIDDQSEFKSTDKQPGNQKSYFRFLDKATIQQDTARSSRPPCTEAQLQKSKQVCGMILIWLVLLIPSTIWAQINTLFVKQGTTLNRHIGKSFQVPAASLGSFVTLSMLLTVPIYDRYFVPLMRARTGNPRGITLLQRLGIGCIVQIVAIAIAYTVEMRRMHVINVEHVIGNKSSLHMSIFWLMPQYALIGVADVFNSIGLLEFFYDQSPDDMQSLGTTFFTSAIGVGNFLNSFLVTMVDRITGRNGGKSWIGNNLNDCHLDYYYLFLFVLAILNMGAFWWASGVYVYKIGRNGVQEEHNYGPVEGNNNNNNKIIVDASLGL